MSIIRLYWFDLRVSRRMVLASLAAVLVLAGLIMANAALMASFYEQRAAAFSWGDFIASCFSGAQSYEVTQGSQFKPPVGWLLICLLLAYATLLFPYRDLMGAGRAALVAGGGRISWWVAMCLWVITVVCLCWVAVAAAAAVATLICGGPLTLEIHRSMLLVCEVSADHIFADAVDGTPFLLVALLMSAALGIAQLAASLVLRPTFAFAAAVALLLASAFLTSPLLVGSFLMADRWGGMVSSGLGSDAGALVGCALLFAGALAGGLLFRRFDVLDKEMNV
ncbi:hypothetical protein Corgl_0397 [Coriobacterium glomerans PW2]|uniref:Uncharacterized protein n=1 Tax=Coriobacterium glomerans (strain ATCC 49209 / DSM 20642 / JCM 10262 / PW2) TaxID=700015 RepID=F2NAI8_CORGP|nr:hypothetical protein [Coriobacterium glomerans]AEB06515.1 hypothetical protein Corgl_0397 [Coriobacterium glomerans PW2]